MELDEVSALLHPEPLQLETGYERLPSGVLHVAVRTDMHRCLGEMFEWWFRWRCDTQKYVWWHPADHVSSVWEGSLSDDTHVGSEHVVTERLTALPAEDLVIQFRDPSEFFEAKEYESARREQRVSCAVLGRVGFGHEPHRGPSGEVLGGRLLHVGRDTEWGLAMRSHFYLGQDLPATGATPAEVEEAVPTELAGELLQHCYNEFTYLSRFLPSLFIAEHRDTRPPKIPW
ncbi:MULTISPECIES: DAPG hydrolase family protein [unclassified Streptomyces]|uniref:DAPG hydrolase family protein n=1 Tax=unclassified Streptomyces TaxID=2593676 RepID=UPI0034453CC0